jgi:type III restriction enzyme
MTDEARHLRQIAQRLSLRAPQEMSLEILATLVQAVKFGKDLDVVTALEEVQKLYPTVTDFEREFPSVCFAIATGVGKTRLMGAFIAFLFVTGRSKNFFVLAPNTTIYDKLVADFSKQTSPKYVFRGISQFAQSAPIIVTGDTWEEGRGVRGSDLFGGEAIINIFNVDKINKDKGRIRTLRETIGESYFDYLAGLPDLVLLMDEAHRYRGSAGMKAISELKPILGLEMTATPKSVGAKSQAFNNVIFRYGLGDAMKDGFVKEPAVATRANFRREDFNQDQLEQIMLEDAVHYHEQVRTELELYARQSGRPRVHPFVLVVAQDTTHAERIRQVIQSEQFFGGAYKDLVIRVDSKLSGEESDEAVARLVGLETDARTEIVIHVNKLKEGWDVTNLFTIVPLRASASEILTEQTLGRGLRLPYGERTGVETVDTLTVIAHDRFDAVIQQAREADSIVKVKTLTIGPGGDVPEVASRVIDVRPTYDTLLTGRSSDIKDGDAQRPFILDQPAQRVAAELTLDFIRQKYERQLTHATDLRLPEVRKRIVDDVRRALEPTQPSFDGIEQVVDYAGVVEAVTETLVQNLIEIPEIIVLPSRDVTFWFEDFDLKQLDHVRFQPVSETILIRNLRLESQRELARAVTGARESQIENYIIRHLIENPQVDYDTQADLLYKLAGQMITHLRSFLSTEDAVENVALVRGKQLADIILEQMRQHYHETPADYRAKVVRSFRTLQPFAVSAETGAKVLDLKTPSIPLSETRRRLFGGSTKSPYPLHRFDSDPERRFAVMIDSAFERSVLRWLKPGPGQFGIEYHSGKSYEPDFVVETELEKLIVEIKSDNGMSDPTVGEKARAAREWVRHANYLAAQGSGKPWVYVLVPERAVKDSSTLEGILSEFQ